MNTVTQRSFSGGELDPGLHSRVDTTKYTTGVKTMRNMYILRSGGVRTRPGTEFIREVKNSADETRIIGVLYSSESTINNSILIELGDEYLRLHSKTKFAYYNGTVVSSITRASQAVINATAHGISNGDHVVFYYMPEIHQINERCFVAANVTANTIEIKHRDGSAVSSLDFDQLVSSGYVGIIKESVTPYSSVQSQNIQYIQSKETVTFSNNANIPKDLNVTTGSVTDTNYMPFAWICNGFSGSGGPGGATVWEYAVTGIHPDTQEESLIEFTCTHTSGEPTLANPIILSISVSGFSPVTPTRFYIYKKKNGVYSYLGLSDSGTFNDIGATPDSTVTPPIDEDPFVGGYPGVIAQAQQRRYFSSISSDSEKIIASKIGYTNNFSKRLPIQDDDAIDFKIKAKSYMQIKHIVDIGSVIIFTTTGEWAVQGSGNGAITATSLDVKQYSSNGCSDLPPLVMAGNCLYVQARGSIVRDFGFDYSVDGYKGNDLTIFSSHLFDGYTIVDWCWQQTPHSIVWAVRSDGVLLGLTYNRDQQIVGWHKHDFDGLVEKVTIVSQDSDDVYLVIKRTINGTTKRYIERFSPMSVSNVIDYKQLDCSITYDGRNTDDTRTMTLSGGVNWDDDETLTLTCSSSFFLNTDVNKEIHLTLDGEVIRFVIEAYTSGTVVTGVVNRTVPVSMRSVALSEWAKAISVVENLAHLEAKDVSVFADGYVVASPNNAAYDIITVASGSITLPKCYSVIHVGLPITSDLETLDIDIPNTETTSNKATLINQVTLRLQNSRGVWVGPESPEDDGIDPLENLTELKPRSSENYDAPPSLKTQVEKVNIRSEWNSNGRVFVRQVDPIPMTILSISPSGLIPVRGA